MANVTLTAQLKGFDAVGKALDGMASRLKRVGLTAENVSKKLKAAGTNMTAFGKKASLLVSAPLVAAGTAAVKFASDLDESMNKANVTFGASAKIVTAFAETSARSFGIAQADALEYSATLGVILQGSGFAEDAAAGMSTQMVQLAADLASFNNIPIDEALQKIRAGLVGEAEPLRTVGVLLSEAAVQAKALELGLIKDKKELTDQIKVQARFAIIMEQTKAAQGDFARTSESLANQLRILQASIVDAGAELGKVLLPIAQEVISTVVDMVKRFGEMDDKTKRLIIVVAGLAAAVGPVAIVVGTLATGIGTLLPILVSVVPVLAAITAGIVAGALAAQGLQGTFEGVKQVLTDFAKKQGPQVSIALNEMAIGWLKFKRIVAGATGNTEGVKRLTESIDELAQQNFELGKMSDQAEQSGGTVADSFFEGFERGQEKIKQGFRDVADIAKTELGNIANAAVDFILPAAPAAAGGGDSAPIVDVGDAAASVQEVTKEVTKLQEVIEEVRPAATSAFEDIQEGMREWAEESAITLETWGELAQSTFDQFKQGVGDAVAEAIIEGENLAQSMENVLKNVAKSVISTLVQIAIQQLVNLAVSLLTSTAQASTQGATSIALAGSNAYASTAAIPIIGPALAPAAATAAIAGATAAFQAGAAAGKAQGATIGAAAGGMENVPATGTFLLHRGEAVLQREQNQDLRDFLARGGVTGDSVNITFAGPVNFSDAIQKKKTIKDLERGLVRAQRRRAR